MRRSSIHALPSLACLALTAGCSIHTSTTQLRSARDSATPYTPVFAPAAAAGHPGHPGHPGHAADGGHGISDQDQGMWHEARLAQVDVELEQARRERRAAEAARRELEDKLRSRERGTAAAPKRVGTNSGHGPTPTRPPTDGDASPGPGQQVATADAAPEHDRAGRTPPRKTRANRTASKKTPVDGDTPAKTRATGAHPPKMHPVAVGERAAKRKRVAAAKRKRVAAAKQRTRRSTLPKGEVLEKPDAYAQHRGVHKLRPVKTADPDGMQRLASSTKEKRMTQQHVDDRRVMQLEQD